MPQDLIILGAGGTSREIAGAVEDVNGVSPRWRLLGYLDDDVSKAGTTLNGYKVLGPMDAMGDYPDALAVIGVASFKRPLAREEIAARLGLGPERLATIIHPSASISRFSTVGAGSVVLQNVVITPDSVLGMHVIAVQNVCMAHNDVVEDCVTLASAAVVTGGVKLRRGAFIGAGAVIAPAIEVGEEALVAVGAVVLGDVPAGRMALGNPARIMPKR